MAWWECFQHTCVKLLVSSLLAHEECAFKILSLFFWPHSSYISNTDTLMIFCLWCRCNWTLMKQWCFLKEDFGHSECSGFLFLISFMLLQKILNFFLLFIKTKYLRRQIQRKKMIHKRNQCLLKCLKANEAWKWKHVSVYVFTRPLEGKACDFRHWKRRKEELHFEIEWCDIW